VPAVVRKLAEGHFKGVADVRLRIVHADAIAAMQLASDQRVSRAARDGVAQELTATVEAFAATTASEDAGAAVEAFKKAVATPGTDLLAAIDEMEKALFDATAEVEAEAPVGSTPPAEESDVAADDPIAALLVTLRDMVEAANSAALSQALLPPLAEPTGSGKAYARFVEAYEAMRSSQAAGADNGEEHGVDLEA
jgi:hypothetical protein